MSPALAGRFSTTVPPGKPPIVSFLLHADLLNAMPYLTRSKDINCLVFFFQFSFNYYMLTISSSLFILLFILMICFDFSSSCRRLSEMSGDPGLFFLI